MIYGTDLRVRWLFLYVNCQKRQIDNYFTVHWMTLLASPPGVLKGSASPGEAIRVKELHTIEPAPRYNHALETTSFPMQAFAELTPLDRYSSYGC